MMKNSVTDLLDRIKEEFSFHQAQNHRYVKNWPKIEIRCVYGGLEWLKRSKDVS